MKSFIKHASLTVKTCLEADNVRGQRVAGFLYVVIASLVGVLKSFLELATSFRHVAEPQVRVSVGRLLPDDSVVKISSFIRLLILLKAPSFIEPERQ